MSTRHFTPNPYRTEDGTAYIACKNKHGVVVAETMIDEADLDRVLSAAHWYAIWSTGTKTYYVVARKGRVSLHRFLVDAPQGMVVDHINHDTLDNRQSNLRVCTHAQNMQNLQKAHSRSRTGIRGVQWYEKENRWRVRVMVNGQNHNIGYFKTKEDAEAAAIMARLRLMTHATA